MTGIQHRDDEKTSLLRFTSAVKRGRAALWRKGRSIVVIVEGREQEFIFDGRLTETRALALLKASGLTVVREDRPAIAVLGTAIVCMLVLLVLFFLQ